MNLGLLVASENMNKIYPISSGFSTLDHIGNPPLKIKISKIGLRHVLSWPKLGLETKCHGPGTFGGFGKCEQRNKQTDRHTRFMFYKYRYIFEYERSVFIKTDYTV